MIRHGEKPCALLLLLIRLTYQYPPQGSYTLSMSLTYLYPQLGECVSLGTVNADVEDTYCFDVEGIP